MSQRLSIAISALAALVLSACSGGTAVAPVAGMPSSSQHVAPNATTQYLYVYNAGKPGVYSGEYARYGLSKLSLLETTAATGAGSIEAFDSGKPYFVDEATPSGYGVYLQPVKNHTVRGQQQFYGIPCQSPSLAIGPTGDFYVVQYCSTNVLKYAPGVKQGSPKKPIAKYTGGNLGQGGITNPTYAVVDSSGNLYVGDNGGGVTYFAAGSKKGVVAFKTGYSSNVTQMVADSHGDVWSVHAPNPAAVYFGDKTSCVPNPSGSIVRNEYGEHFSKGRLVQHLYSPVTTSPVFSNAPVSIAIDSNGRIYTGNQNSGVKAVVLDFDPGKSCPNDGLSFTTSMGAAPQVAVDNQGNFYVTNYGANSISQYEGGTTTRIRQITQKASLVNITYATVGP